MWTFLLTPLGRKISLGIALTVALLYGYRVITNRAYEAGRLEGSKSTVSSLESLQQQQWKQETTKIQHQIQDVADQVSSLKSQRTTLESQRSVVVQKVQTTTCSYDGQKTEILKQVADLNAEGVAAVAARVDTLLQSFGDPQQALIALETAPVLEREVTDLKSLLNDLQTNSDEDRKLSAAELAAAHDMTAAVQSQLAQAGRERDFYRDAYKVLTKKPSRWHTVLKIITLGVAR